MSNTIRIACVACVFHMTVLGASSLIGQTIEDEKVFDEAKALYARTLDAIHSIDLTYDDTALQFKCGHYVADGKKHYAAVAVYDLDRHINHAVEEAWDGTRSYRRSVEMLCVTGAEGEPNPEPMQPDRFAGMETVEALGLKSPRVINISYQLRSASWQTMGNNRAAKLDFAEMMITARRGPDNKPMIVGPIQQTGTTSITLSSTVGYWPVKIERTGAGFTQYIDDLHYANPVVNGTQLFYPISAKWITVKNGTESVIGETHVTSLQLNQRIPPSQFVLEPWPSQTVLDGDTSKTTPAMQPGWDASSVGFPFGEFVAALKRAQHAPSAGDSKQPG